MLEHQRELSEEEAKAMKNAMSNLISGKTCCDKSCEESADTALLRRQVIDLESQRESLRNEMIHMAKKIELCEESALKTISSNEMKLNVSYALKVCFANDAQDLVSLLYSFAI